ncbi:MAG TPA: GNAT family N-acetyltransferase [Haloplasmataceae bacterium]
MRTIKLIPDEHLKEVVNIYINSYPAYKVTEEYKERLLNRFKFLQEKHPFAKFYGIYEDSSLLGKMIIYSYNMNYNGHKLKVNGVGAIGVDLLHKKEKLAKDLVTYFLNHSKEQGVNLAILYPFRPDFYKKMGFGYGTKMNQYVIKPESFPKGNKQGLSYLNLDDAQAMCDCYNRVAKVTHGMIEMYDWEFKEYFNNPNLKIIGYKENDRIEGYLMFTFNNDASFLINDIKVHSIIYENCKALSQILAFLNSQSDQVRHCIINTLDDNFHFLLNDPRNNSNNLIPSVYHESNKQGVGLMYRVIDIVGIFNDLKKYNFNNQNLILKLSITDSFIKDNDKSFIIEFIDGYAKTSDNKKYDVEIKLDIADFSSMLLGVVDFKSLYYYNLAKISDLSYLDAVNTVFKMERKPICLTDF